METLPYYKRRLIFWLLALAGCQSSPPVVHKWAETISERRIEIGTTTQNQFEELLGKPDLVTPSVDGNVIWTYSNKSYDPETGVFSNSLTVFTADKDLNPDVDYGYDLILHFDLQNTVSDYYLVPSQF